MSCRGKSNTDWFNGVTTAWMDPGDGVGDIHGSG